MKVDKLIKDIAEFPMIHPIAVEAIMDAPVVVCIPGKGKSRFFNIKEAHLVFDAPEPTLFMLAGEEITGPKSRRG